MKKSKLLLLASVALLLTSCGTKYTLKGDDDNVLTLGGSSFTMVNEDDDLITTTKGKVEKLDEEGKYELTVTSQSYKLEKGETLSKVEEALLGLTWSTEDIDSLKDGKTVTHKLDEDDYYTIKISVDEETKSYQVVLF